MGIFPEREGIFFFVILFSNLIAAVHSISSGLEVTKIAVVNLHVEMTLFELLNREIVFCIAPFTC